MTVLVLLHMTCSLLSYVAFLVAFVAGLLFLVQERQVKHKHMGSLFHKLPSLGRLDRVNFWAIGLGFALLSAGVACGLLGTRLVFGLWWTGDSKEYLSLMLWGWYLLLWVVRMRSTLRGRRVALLSILGFSFVIFAFIGARLILASGHPYV